MSKEGTSTVVRAVTLPVAVPLGDDPTGSPWTWETFNAALKAAFRLSTDLANWAQGELARRDVRRSPEMESLPRFDPAGVYGTVPRRFARKAKGGKRPAKAGDPMTGSLYDLFNRECPFRDRFEFAAATAQLILRKVETDWKEHSDHGRYAVIWRGDSRAMFLRYPQPFPVHNANWKTEYADGDFPTVRLALPGVGQVELRLKRRADFGRQLAMFKALHDGTAKKGEAALYRDRKGVLLKLVGHFPRRERTEADNVCFLHTDPNALLVAEINGRSVTVTNGDHLKRAHAVIRETADRHRRFLRRVSEDKKREVRMDPRQRDNVNKKVEDRCGKQRARIDTAIKQIAAQVARFLERQRVGLVAYDDAVKSFLPDGFAWHTLKSRLAQLFVGEMGGEWVDGQFTHLTDQMERQKWLERARNTATAGKRAVAHKRRSGSHPKVTPAR